MFKKIINFSYILLFFVFVASTLSFYFSDDNMRKTHKNRSFYMTKTDEEFNNIPLLENDTREIIVYTNEIENFKKNKKKYKFWDLIKDK